MKTVLTIAGFDPSSGAGVTADLMVFAAHGLLGTSCITALTVQSTIGVAASHPVAADAVRATLDQLQDDMPAAGIKIGMLATAETVEVVADFLKRVPGIPIVLDPVLRSSSGRELLSAAGVALLRERLLPLVHWVTPNLEELGILAEQDVTTREDMERAGRVLLHRYPGLTVMATGGHLERPDDLLLTGEGKEDWLPGEAIVTSSTHGTGCALSSAVLSNLVLGDTTLASAIAAKAYVYKALQSAIPRGRGHGPINFLWPLKK
jgi:hydroxymethylpyrimidine/phosphomethylpyrimidine kinase